MKVLPSLYKIDHIITIRMSILKETTQGKTTQLNTILSWITTTPRLEQSRHIVTLQLILAWGILIAIGYVIAYQIFYKEPPIAPMWRLILFIAFYAIRLLNFQEILHFYNTKNRLIKNLFM